VLLKQALPAELTERLLAPTLSAKVETQEIEMEVKLFRDEGCLPASGSSTSQTTNKQTTDPRTSRPLSL